MIILGRDICGNLEISSRKEWLETNGIGGYAYGTVSGLHTRSYHSLLTAALEVPLRRVIMLSQLEETINYGNKRYVLSTNQYKQTVPAEGYLNMEEFRLDPFPVITYRLADLLLEKQIFMSYGFNLTWITYRLLTPLPENSEMRLTVRPLVNFRDHHLKKSEQHFFFSTHHDLEKKVVRLMPDKNLPALNMYHNASGFEHSAQWYHDIFYQEEKQRGLECTEDVFSPGIINYSFNKENDLGFMAVTTNVLDNPDPEVAANAERIRRRELIKAIEPGDRFGKMLALTADQFIVKRDEGLSVMAGYPWLPDSGREAMIAMPGLTMILNRKEETRTLLQTFAGYCYKGMFPNYFNETDAKPFYNSVDAALWFFVAVYQYRRFFGDDDFIRQELWKIMLEIIERYTKGTLYNIKMDKDGLINIPEEGGQLTWMDAQVGDWIVTPRSGKPVEVNALWYNALCFMRDLAETFGEQKKQKRFSELAEKTKAAFQTAFWNEIKNYCYDRIEEHYQDPSLRPNQLIALALPYPVVPADQAKKILKIIRQELYTTFGLGTLNHDHEDYQGNYAGDIISREGAAHQGTVWPWLLGPYADSLRQVYGNTPETRAEIRRLLKPFEAHIKEAGLGSISEMFDGDPPHSARGCVSRACNVAEILRLHLELLKDKS
ncbi:glycogen debranching enzyme family protein [bacterium]|nr:glycogen debranching enzyme family protein [bacterium]